MAKLKRLTVGSIVKAKEEGKPSYIKLRGETLQDFAKALLKMDPEKGGTMKLESKKFQLESLRQAVADGKLSAERAGQVEERINKMPDYVVAEMIVLQEADPTY